MTNLAGLAHADAPLFLFYLLEWCDVDFDLDVNELNDRWADPQNIDRWVQLVIKYTADTVELVTAAPRSGVWRIAADGQALFERVQTHRWTMLAASGQPTCAAVRRRSGHAGRGFWSATTIMLHASGRQRSLTRRGTASGSSP